MFTAHVAEKRAWRKAVMRFHAPSSNWTWKSDMLRLLSYFPTHLNYVSTRYVFYSCLTLFCRCFPLLFCSWIHDNCLEFKHSTAETSLPLHRLNSHRPAPICAHPWAEKNRWMGCRWFLVSKWQGNSGLIRFHITWRSRCFCWGNPCKLTVDRVFSQIINVGRLFFAHYGDAVI